MEFQTMRLPALRDAVAPDGSDVRVLLRFDGGSMAHFELAPGRTSQAVAHRTVDEIWFVLAGRGEIWRQQGDREETATLEPDVCVSIPVGTRFQFRSTGAGPLAVIAITMPAWPGEDEAFEVEGRWPVRRRRARRHAG